MKKLGTLVLPDSLQWIDRYTASPVVRTVVHTLAGTPVAFSRKVGGVPVTLAATGDSTWLDQAATDLLAGMAAEADAVYTLVWEEASFVVVFRHDEPPALSMTPVWPHHDQFVGTIRLSRI